MLRTFLLCLKVIFGLSSSKKRKRRFLTPFSGEAQAKIIRAADLPFFENYTIIIRYFKDIPSGILLKKLYECGNYDEINGFSKKFKSVDFYDLLNNYPDASSFVRKFNLGDKIFGIMCKRRETKFFSINLQISGYLLKEMLEWFIEKDSADMVAGIIYYINSFYIFKELSEYSSSSSFSSSFSQSEKERSEKEKSEKEKGEKEESEREKSDKEKSKNAVKHYFVHYDALTIAIANNQLSFIKMILQSIDELGYDFDYYSAYLRALRCYDLEILEIIIPVYLKNAKNKPFASTCCFCDILKKIASFSLISHFTSHFSSSFFAPFSPSFSLCEKEKDRNEKSEEIDINVYLNPSYQCNSFSQSEKEKNEKSKKIAESVIRILTFLKKNYGGCCTKEVVIFAAKDYFKDKKLFLFEILKLLPS